MWLVLRRRRSSEKAWTHNLVLSLGPCIITTLSTSSSLSVIVPWCLCSFWNKKIPFQFNCSFYPVTPIFVQFFLTFLCPLSLLTIYAAHTTRPNFGTHIQEKLKMSPSPHLHSPSNCRIMYYEVPYLPLFTYYCTKEMVNPVFLSMLRSLPIIKFAFFKLQFTPVMSKLFCSFAPNFPFIVE